MLWTQKPSTGVKISTFLRKKWEMRAWITKWTFKIIKSPLCIHYLINQHIVLASVLDTLQNADPTNHILIHQVIRPTCIILKSSHLQTPFMFDHIWNTARQGNCSETDQECNDLECSFEEIHMICRLYSIKFEM